MSKQSEAKKQQGYRTEPNTCANCANFSFEMRPIKWMVEENKDCEANGRKPRYNIYSPECLKETNLRCGIGGFAVKKNATCNQHKLKEE